MKGYRTIIANAVMLAASGLALAGIDVGVEQQAAIVMAIMTVANIGLRLATSTPVGTKE
jgi:hypothetical protein